MRMHTGADIGLVCRMEKIVRTCADDGSESNPRPPARTVNIISTKPGAPRIGQGLAKSANFVFLMLAELHSPVRQLRHEQYGCRMGRTGLSTTHDAMGTKVIQDGHLQFS